LTGTQQPERIGGYRQLVTAMWGLSTGMRPIETAKVEWEHLKTAVEQGYFEAPAIMTKTGEGRVIPLHPQVKPYIELLIKAGEDNPRLLPQPFNNEKFRKGRTKYGANLVLAQYRNLPVMEWRNHGIDPTVRLAIMGHDQHLVLDALRSSGLSKVEQEKVKAEELEASGEMTQTYGKLQPAGIASEYQKTVGKWKFIPKEISIKQITPLLEKQKK
jgi:integrase